MRSHPQFLMHQAQAQKPPITVIPVVQRNINPKSPGYGRVTVRLLEVHNTIPASYGRTMDVCMSAEEALALSQTLALAAAKKA